ncbi:MAG: MoaF N-terminal domain-containing protein [Lachnospiraceae bacterium]|jgi:hypothetical protein|nr:MoaF N-terminal domain-containing protein [Lachnospiraceae bacterium]
MPKETKKSNIAERQASDTTAQGPPGAAGNPDAVPPLGAAANITGQTFTGAEAMYTTEFEGISQYRRPYCFELAGRTFDIVFDDGMEVAVTFDDGHRLTWSANGCEKESHGYDCLKATDEHYLVHFEKKGRWPREGVTLIIDLHQDLCTGNFSTQGEDPTFVNLVKRTLRFGALRIPGKPLPTARHCHTTDMVGKKICYTYSPVFSITHIYFTDRLSRAVLSRQTIDETMDDAQKKEQANRKLFEEESIYLKIDENVYVYSWIEKNFGSGTQGFMLMDTHRVTDVGCFFGVNPQGQPESYMISAFGKYVTDTFPEETAPSPYTYDFQWEMPSAKSK